MQILYKSVLIVVFLVLSNLGATAQSGWVYNDKFQNMPIREVFSLLDKKYGLQFAFDYSTIEHIRITKQVHAKDINTALVQLFEGTGLMYQVAGNKQILVRLSPVEKTPTEISSASILPKIPRSVSGTIFDNFNRKPLAFAHVSSGQGQGAISDDDGNFSLELADASVTTELEVQYLGYQSKSIYLNPGIEPAKIDIRLTPKIEELQAFTITDHPPLTSQSLQLDGLTVPARTLSVSSFIAGNDIMRNLQLLPGIAAFDDLSAGLNVRGGTGDDNLVILDGIPLYNVTHYFGVFSVVNSDVIKEVRLFKNAFPAEYGGRTAAVLDMTTLSPDPGKTRGILNANLLTTDAVIDAPLTNKMRIMVAGRTTNQNLGTSKIFGYLNQEPRQSPVYKEAEKNPNPLVSRDLIAQKPDFRFYDANIKWSWQPTTKTKVQFSYFKGNDQFRYDYNQKVKPINRLPLPDSLLPQNLSYKENGTWDNQGWSIQLEQKWKAPITSHLTIAQSQYTLNRSMVNVDTRTLITRRDTFTKSNSYQNLHYNSLSGADLHLKNEWTINKTQSLQFGYQFTLNDVKYRIDEDNRVLLNNARRGFQHSFYTQYHIAPESHLLNFTLGLRATNYNNNFYFSPRVNLVVGKYDWLKVKAAWSIYQQYTYQLNHEDRYGRSFLYWVMADDKLPVAVCNQLMFGAAHHNNWFDVDLEFYQKNTRGIVEQAQNLTGLAVIDGKIVPRNFTLFEGTGKTLGMDLLIRKNAGNFSGWIAYTLSKTTQSFPQIDRGKPFFAPTDRRHQLKWISQYRIGRFDASFTYIFASGRPYTDLSKLTYVSSERGSLTPSARQTNLESYQRADLSGNYNFNWGKTKVQAGFTLFNLFNRQNVKYRQYIYSFPTLDNSGSGSGSGGSGTGGGNGSGSSGSGSGSKNVQNTVVGTEFQMLNFTPTFNLLFRF